MYVFTFLSQIVCIVCIYPRYGTLWLIERLIDWEEISHFLCGFLISSVVFWSLLNVLFSFFTWYLDFKIQWKYHISACFVIKIFTEKIQKSCAKIRNVCQIVYLCLLWYAPWYFIFYWILHAMMNQSCIIQCQAYEDIVLKFIC